MFLRISKDIQALTPQSPATQPTVEEKPSATIATSSIIPSQSTSEIRSTLLNEYSADDGNTNKSVMAILDEKIRWAVEELRSSNNVKYNIELCEMIKSASEARGALKRF